MAINSAVAQALEEQINAELYSSYLYLTFADYYEDRGLKGFANWYMIQVKEEADHALAIRRYLLDNDYKPTMEAIAKPDKVFETLSRLRLALPMRSTSPASFTTATRSPMRCTTSVPCRCSIGLLRSRARRKQTRATWSPT